ncbi:Rap1a/Tai family immunity protein [Bradyrhizobium cosmicum]|uniref:Rap1a/Tai family immunity protein n=1 Tax=Bradyrhizobium cosmicum TaxID=1404864 RepID=UPI0039656451
MSEESARAFLQGYCAGLVVGLRYMYDDACVPDGATPNQVLRVVVQYIDSRPARLHEDFRILALEAMKQSWPCNR